MRYGFINNFSQALAADLAAGATTLTLDGGGSLLADASTDYRYKLTLVQKDAFGNETHREIVDVTAASGDTLTIVGEQEGTTRLAGGWPSGTTVAARVTAGHLEAFQPEPSIRPALIEMGPIDFSDAQSSVSYAVEAGRALYVDSVEVIPAAGGSSGSWSVEAGTPAVGGRGVALAYNNDESLVAVAHFNSPGLTVISTSDWSVVPGTPSLGGSVYGVAFSPNGAYLAVVYSGSSPYFKVFNTGDWSDVSGTPVRSGMIFGGVEFSPDGSFLAVGNPYGDGVIIVETTGWTTTQTLTAINADCQDLRWSPDGSLLAQIHNQPGYKIFETSTWTEVQSSTLPASVYSASFSPDGSLLAMGYDGGDDEVHLFNTSTWVDTASSLPFFASMIASVAWMPSGDQIAVGYSASQVAIVNVSDWSTAATIPTNGTAWSVKPNSAGDQLIAGTASSPYFTAAGVSAIAAPTLNLGVDSGSASGLVSAAPLETFVDGRRIPVDVAHRTPVNSLYAEPGSATDAGAASTLIVRGYTLES